MNLSKDDLIQLVRIAEEAAHKAGQLINSFSNTEFKITHKKGGHSLASKVVTEVDYRCESLILAHLKESLEKYDLAILSEEQEDDKQRLNKDHFWCIDPLDGTLAFTESQAGYAVSIALVSKDGMPLIGVIYDPLKNTLYSAIKGHGAFRNGSRWSLPHSTEITTLTLPCDRSLLVRQEFNELRNTLNNWAVNSGFTGLTEIHHGGAVMNACWALEHTPACYFKLPKPENGGGSLWDFAATACLYSEMGASVCDFKGQALDLNRADSTFMNHRGVIFASDSTMLAIIQSLQTLDRSSPTVARHYL
jgi:3'-phosphoadenosine 5'-phosphosulfate (PAPS) 3'-phosphatase